VSTTAVVNPGRPQRFGHRRSQQFTERVIAAVLFGCAAVTVLTTVGIVVILFSEGLSFFREIHPVDFLTGTRWTPASGNFGVLPLILGTLMIAVGASFISIPVGTLSAIFLAEYASPKVRSIIKPILEVLAGIPTIVYGFFALTFITPLLRDSWLPDVGIFNALSAMIVVGIMTVPMVSSISDDSLRAVPESLREAAYGVGATKFEVITRVTFPSALSGIVASYILAISRAVGETMAVTVAAGATPHLTLNPLESVQTMTAYIVQVTQGEAPHGTIEFRTIFAIAMTLFAMTMIMNLLSARIVSKFRERYE